MDPGNVKCACRVCGEELDNMLSLFRAKRNGLILAEMLTTCIRSEIYRNDLLPTNICLSCVEHLCAAYAFYSLAKKNEAKFRTLIAAAQTGQEIHGSIKSENDLEMNDGLAFIENDGFEDVNFGVPSANLPKLELLESFASPATSKETTKPVKMSKDPFDSSPELSDSSDFPDFADVADLSEVSELMDEPTPPKKKSTVKVKKVGRLFECYLCKTTLKSFKESRKHLGAHNEATPNVCEICHLRFSAKAWAEHLCKGQIVNCEYCPETFHSTVTLMEHLNCHKDQHNLYKCTECPKIYAVLWLLEVHKREHNNMEKIYGCDLCERRFKSNWLLTKHRATHSPTRGKVFGCSLCEIFLKYDLIEYDSNLSVFSSSSLFRMW